MTEAGSPFLKMGITLAIFKLVGKTPVEMNKLKILTKAGMSIGAESLINLIEK